jgi:YHS domain-containing protein
MDLSNGKTQTLYPCEQNYLQGDDTMKKVIMVILGLILALALAGAGNAQPPEKAQVVCPVLGGKIDKSVHADYQGQRVYFCCAGCDGRFQQTPKKYLEKMKAQGIIPEKATGGK